MVRDPHGVQVGCRWVSLLGLILLLHKDCSWCGGKFSKLSKALTVTTDTLSPWSPQIRAASKPEALSTLRAIQLVPFPMCAVIGWKSTFLSLIWGTTAPEPQPGLRMGSLKMEDEKLSDMASSSSIYSANIERVPAAPGQALF